MNIIWDAGGCNKNLSRVWEYTGVYCEFQYAGPLVEECFDTVPEAGKRLIELGQALYPKWIAPVFEYDRCAIIYPEPTNIIALALN